MDSQLKIAKIERALNALERHETDCALCPRECHVDRRKGRAGICQSGTRAALSHALLHYGEEPVLSGLDDCAGGRQERKSHGRGSGTIFFTGCNLKCLFCQNYQLSWFRQGREVEDEELAEAMLDLQDKGALNINLVSPTHFIVPILRALKIASGRGLRIPLISNSNGYEKTDVVEQLAGIVDIYLPDLKYCSSRISKAYSGAEDYFLHARQALQEMFVQQPDFVLDEWGIAQRGMIVRHLILPGHADDSGAVLEWLARDLSPSVPVSLMSQYRPCFRAPEEIQKSLTADEYRAVLRKAERLGLETIFVQPEVFETDAHLVPDFNREKPFLWRK